MRTILISILLLSFFGCNKKMPTQWTVHGVTYKSQISNAEEGTFYNIEEGELDGNDKKGDVIELFLSTNHIVTRNYPVKTRTAISDTNICLIELFSADKNIWYHTTGQLNDSVKVVVANGNITATFSNIKIKGMSKDTVDDITTISGQIVNSIKK